MATVDKKIDIAANLNKIRQDILKAAAAAGTDAAKIRLIAVSKTHPTSLIREAFAAGQFEFGENYVQEAVEKIEELRPKFKTKVKWHFVGQLQSNKVKLLKDSINLVHSLDRPSLAKALEDQAAKLAFTLNALVQINIDAEPGKGGVAPEELEKFLKTCVPYSHLRIQGLMCIPNPEKQKKDPRGAFARLRELRERMNKIKVYPHALSHLSMGMSADYIAAIQEGATLIRIGSAIFGPRSK